MQQSDTIAITGAAGFVGSCLIAHLNELGYTQLILVDDFSKKEKAANLQGKQYLHKVHRDQFIEWCNHHPNTVQFMFHLGAVTDTMLEDYSVFKTMNLNYSKDIWEYCTEQKIPLVYASSAATYGGGSEGYDDDEKRISSLKPLNAYAISKNEFDKWALEQKHKPPFWAGLKFFNVYGPNEYHKGKMASVIFHVYNQIKTNGKAVLFRSHKEGIKDGEQQRDFIYVKDIVSICAWLMTHQKKSGIYNAGTGKARTFIDLVHAIFAAIDMKPNITFVDTPESIREAYQYFTEANMQKLKSIGYTAAFTPLEDGVKEYVQQYLEKVAYY